MFFLTNSLLTLSQVLLHLLCDSQCRYCNFIGTPITRPPVLGNQDLDLYKLYKIVQEHGGMEKVTSGTLASIVISCNCSEWFVACFFLLL